MMVIMKAKQKMFERKTATSVTTSSEAHDSNSNNNYTTTNQAPSLSINSSVGLPEHNHHQQHFPSSLSSSSSQQHQQPLTNSPSNLSILRDYKHHQQQQGNTHHNNTSPQTPPHSPRQNSNNTTTNGNASPSTASSTTNTTTNTNKRLSIKLASNSSKRLSVNLLLNKLSGVGGGNNDNAALQHHLQQYSSSMMRHGSGTGGGAQGGVGGGSNSIAPGGGGIGSSNALIGNMDSMNNALMSREGSQILLGVPYKEGLGYRKTSHWPYRYNKRYFVLKNHHLRIYRAINDYQQHQQYSSIVKHALKQQQHGDSNMNGNVVAINNIINHDLYNSRDDSNNLSNHSIVSPYSSFTSNMITTPSGDMIPKVDTSSFMLYKIPLKYCKIFKFHTTNTNESTNLDYRSSASEMNAKDVPSKSFATTDKKDEKKEDDEEEEFELHFLPPPTYTGPGVTGQKAYKLHENEEGNTNNMSSSPSSVIHGDEVASGSGANSAIFKLKFKGTANDWFKLLDKAIFLASKTGDNEEEDVWNQEQKKDFDEEEWLSQYKKEQQQDMMDLPVFLRPLQMQIKQHNDEMLIDHQEKQKQISAEKNMSLKKRLSQYFSGSGASNANSNNNNKRNSGNSYAYVSEKPFDLKSDNLVDSISESTTSHNSSNEKRKSGYVIDDSIPDITDMSQLQDLIRQHDDDDYSQPSQPKFASDHKTTNHAVSSLKTEEKKNSALHRLSTNLSELFSKKKQQSNTQVPDNSDTISVDGKKEKRKSVFGRLLNINKEK
ncbi:hypothetical protein NAEGRDRAFT_57022 [Naegleria gruberi]|uniref:PH domain-containing protein n=1 Tax=Naegleria gruberi TaxID=5762 RepID=D2V3M0_NAEGR|nr:uncharacterized protein NAEGRDRAFT_57022 [Naegleria gruberi]EFC48661.1 hypothetical protein NAEGRDRAFT_57022 [Naegleria gruberi]|eukprot:XP_002681405.1 hypothetical protein NAEGRDRAFT_57022 [Naegleria gruberi strain NEG-M]